MKSQTKIIIATLVAAVVAFSAVGATYAWFSDTEKTDVSVSTGTVDVSYEASDLKMYSYDSTATATDYYKEVTSDGKFTCGGSADLTPFDDSAKVTISNMAPGDKITFTLTAYNESSLNIQYRTLLNVTGEKGDLTITGATEGASDWTTVAGVTAKAQLGDAMEITIAIPIESAKAVNCEIVFTLEAVQSNADPYTYISTVDQLYAFANDVNIAGNTYSGKTIKLCADLDLGGAEWTPISGKENGLVYVGFQGIFDGNGKTVSNFKVTEVNHCAGFFGEIYNKNAVVKDLTIDNATITSNHFSGGIVGHMGSGTISGCNVTNSNISAAIEEVSEGTWDNGDKVGGIAGFAQGTIENCAVSSTKITAYRDIGGIAGASGTPSSSASTVALLTVKDCTVTNVTICQNLAHDGKGIDTNGVTDSGNGYYTWDSVCSARNIWNNGTDTTYTHSADGVTFSQC